MFDTGYTVTVQTLDENSESVVVTVTIDLKEVAFYTMFLPDEDITSVASLKTERYRGYYYHGSS